MTTTEKLQDKRQTLRGMMAEAVRAYLSIVYLATWMMSFFFRNVISRRILPFLLLILALAEIIPSLGFRLTVLLSSPGYELIVAVTMSSAAALLVSSHLSLQKQLARQSFLVSSAGVAIERETGIGTGKSPRNEHVMQVQTVLEMLKRVVSFRRERARLSALLLAPSGESFRLFVQDTQQLFTDDAGLGAASWALAKVVKRFPNSIVYIPRVTFSHGVRIHGAEIHPLLDVVPNFNMPISFTSLMATSVLIKDSDEDNHSIAVLILLSSRANYMGMIDFQALRIASRLIANIYSARVGQESVPIWETLRLDE